MGRTCTLVHAWFSDACWSCQIPRAMTHFWWLFESLLPLWDTWGVPMLLYKRGTPQHGWEILLPMMCCKYSTLSLFYVLVLNSLLIVLWSYFLTCLAVPLATSIMRLRNSCSPVVLLDLALRRVQRDTSTFISFSTTPFTLFPMFRLLFPRVLNKCMRSGASDCVVEAIASIEKDCSRWRLLGPLDIMSNEISRCSCSSRAEMHMFDDVFHFLEASNAAILLPVCTLIAVRYLLVLLFLAIKFYPLTY